MEEYQTYSHDQHNAQYDGYTTGYEIGYHIGDVELDEDDIPGEFKDVGKLQEYYTQGWINGNIQGEMDYNIDTCGDY